MASDTSLQASGGLSRHASITTNNTYTLPKKLIVCCDGTWMNSDSGWVKGSWGKRGYPQNPSNVTRIARAISSEDDSHHPQIVYYQAGIGTGIGLTNHVIGGGTGLGLAENIREAYAFIASNYRENDPERPGVDPDSIFLIGFSRGAFTVRSIAGLIGAFGVLKKRAMPHFYEIFEDWENAGNPRYQPLFWDRYLKQHDDLKYVKPPDDLAHDKNRINEYLVRYRNLLLDLALTQEVQIKCIGVWDTVGALGVPVNPLLQRTLKLPAFLRQYSFFDTNLDQNVENAFQALALDEHRFPFTPTLWENNKGLKTNMKQVWFPGVHSNVGGSYADAGMADITLAWMMDQLAGNTTEHPNGIRHRDWIKFDEDYLKYWTNSELTWYMQHKKQAYRGWGMGYIYESNNFPQTLNGSTTRKPGLYHRIDYETGKPTTELLRHTNEFVHSSVRARIDMAGRAVEPDWSAVFPSGLELRPLLQWLWSKVVGMVHRPYQPQRNNGPLHEWRLVDGHTSHRHPNLEIDMDKEEMGKILWLYEGKRPCDNRILPEDKLGKFERMLLQKDQELAKQIEISNNGWVWYKNQGKEPNLRHSHTL